MCRRGSAQVDPIQPLCVLTGWCAQGDLVAQALRARVRPWLERGAKPCDVSLRAWMCSNCTEPLRLTHKDMRAPWPGEELPSKQQVPSTSAPHSAEGRSSSVPRESGTHGARPETAHRGQRLVRRV